MWMNVRLFPDCALEETASTLSDRTSANVPRAIGKARPTRSAKVWQTKHVKTSKIQADEEKTVLSAYLKI